MSLLQRCVLLRTSPCAYSVGDVGLISTWDGTRPAVVGDCELKSWAAPRLVWTAEQVRDTVSGMNPLPIHLHRHVYWIVPLLVIGVLLLVYWALTTSGGDSRGPQL